MEFLRLRTSLQKINPKNVGRKTHLFEQSDNTGRGTNLFNQPEILHEDTIRDDSEFPEIKRTKRVINETKEVKEVTLDTLLESTKNTQSNAPILEEDLKILNESNILPDLELKLDNRVRVAEKLLEESTILQDYNLQLEKKQRSSDISIGDLIQPLSSSGILNESSIVSAINELYDEDSLDENNILDESVFDGLKSSTINQIDGNTSLLGECGIIEESTFSDLDKTIPERLLNEEKVERDGNFVDIKQMFPDPTLLVDDNIIEEQLFIDLDDRVLTPTLLEDDNVIEEDKFKNIESFIKTPTLLEDDKIINDVSFDNIEKFTPQPTLLETDNIVNETIFNEIDNTNPVVLLEEGNIIPDDGNNDKESNKPILDETNLLQEKENKPKKKKKKSDGMLDEDNIKTD